MESSYSAKMGLVKCEFGAYFGSWVNAQRHSMNCCFDIGRHIGLSNKGL